MLNRMQTNFDSFRIPFTGVLNNTAVQTKAVNAKLVDNVSSNGHQVGKQSAV